MAVGIDDGSLAVGLDDGTIQTLTPSRLASRAARSYGLLHPTSNSVIAAYIRKLNVHLLAGLQTKSNRNLNMGSLRGAPIHLGQRYS